MRGGMLLVLASTLVAAGWLAAERLGDETVVTNASGQPLPQGATDADWIVTFSDEFLGDREVDNDRWVTCYWWEDDGCTNLGNRNAQWYLPSALSVSDGRLVIEATEDPVVGIDDTTFPYRSGIVTTGRMEDDLDLEPRYSFTYGWAEMRARVPAGQGLWSAFWMLPVTHESKPEIDVMEVLGDRPDMYEAHVHWEDEDGDDRSAGESWRGPDFSDGFHTFGVHWAPDSLTWYVDGVPRWSVEEAEMIPQEPMYLLANLAVGGEWSGYPDDDTEFPAHLEIDYIRVWQTADRLR